MNVGRVQGKVALITGAARGIGRSNAVRLAEEGADIIAVDVCRDLPMLRYNLSTEADLAETAKLVEALGRRVITRVADTRDLPSLRGAVDEGVAELGKLDIVSANAGVWTCQTWDDVSAEVWADTLAVNLTGTWHTCLATIPHLIDNGAGSIVITGSTSAEKGLPFNTPYATTKHGVVGMARSLANELAVKNIRVNVVHPTGVNTPMLVGGGVPVPDLIAGNPRVGPTFENALAVDFVEPIDVSNMVLQLASDESRYLTGGEYRVDAGALMR
jgi:SDR family mycofactocin-dependent oxidoreductase